MFGGTGTVSAVAHKNR